MELIFVAIFACDILVNLNTGVYMSGKLNVSHWTIFKVYAKSWLFIDLLSTIPFSLMMSDEEFAECWSSIPRVGKILRIWRVTKLFKLFRLLKLRLIILKIEDNVTNKRVSNLLSMCKFSIKLLVISHWLACMWHLIGEYEYENHNMNWISDYEIKVG